MPTPDEAFLDDPVAFMEANVVNVGVGELVGGIYSVTLTPIDAGSYVLQRNLTQGNGFDTYWLPYKDNSLYHLELRNDARFLFTPRMDGCTFGVSELQERKNGIFSVFSKKKHFAQVSHVNMQDDNGKIDQPRMNFMVRRYHEESKGRVRLLKKSDYLDPDESREMNDQVAYKVTTFGVRRGGKWRFYYQAYRIHFTGTYVLIGVNRL
jgi:hypothetical protein